MDSDANDLKPPGHVSTQDGDQQAQDSNCNYHYVPSSQCDANSNNQNIYVGLANYHNVKTHINKKKHVAPYSKLSSENVSRGQDTHNVGKILERTNTRCYVPGNGFGDVDNEDDGDDDEANDNIKRGSTLPENVPQIDSIHICQADNPSECNRHLQHHLSAFANVLNSELNHSFDAKLKETNEYDVAKIQHTPNGNSQTASCKLLPGGSTLILDSMETQGSFEISKTEEKNEVPRDFLKDSNKVNMSSNNEGRNEVDKETSKQASHCLDSLVLYTTRGSDSQTCFVNRDSKTNGKNVPWQGPGSEFVGASERKHSLHNDGQARHRSQDLVQNIVNVKKHEHDYSQGSLSDDVLVDNGTNLSKTNDVNSLQNIINCNSDIPADGCMYVERFFDTFGEISDKASEVPLHSSTPHINTSPDRAPPDNGERGDRSLFPSSSPGANGPSRADAAATHHDVEALWQARDACAEHRQLREESRARMRAHLIMYRRLMLLRLIRALRLKTLEQQSRLQCCYDVILDTRKEVLKAGAIDQLHASV